VCIERSRHSFETFLFCVWQTFLRIAGSLCVILFFFFSHACCASACVSAFVCVCLYFLKRLYCVAGGMSANNDNQYVFLVGLFWCM